MSGEPSGCPPFWRPAARAELEFYAKCLRQIRQFFAERAVLEVHTPILMPAGVTDRHIEAFKTPWQAPGIDGMLYLQTSPEYAMKRLLVEGSGDIYQIGPACRNEELGRWHWPAFTLLEWYRVGFDHCQLMAEVAELLMSVFNLPDTQYFSYTELFAGVAQVDVTQLADAQLDLLMCEQIEPWLAQYPLAIVYDYPASQAALAKLYQPEGAAVPVAARFEVYVHGVECGNGFDELTDAAEQRARFEADNQWRQVNGLAIVPLDEAFLAALEQGLPACAGVALGLDRLIAAVQRQPGLLASTTN